MRRGWYRRSASGNGWRCRVASGRTDRAQQSQLFGTVPVTIAIVVCRRRWKPKGKGGGQAPIHRRYTYTYVGISMLSYAWLYTNTVFYTFIYCTVFTFANVCVCAQFSLLRPPLKLLWDNNIAIHNIYMCVCVCVIYIRRKPLVGSVAVVIHCQRNNCPGPKRNYRRPSCTSDRLFIVH